MSSELMAALGGALFAVVMDRIVIARAQAASTARGLAMAFSEELAAAEFSQPASSGRAQALEFAGFSSQTFDTLFESLANTLPKSLAEDLMRYHWRMKFFSDQLAHGHNLGRHATMLQEAADLHARLLIRLRVYAQRSVVGLALNRRETLRKELVQP